jgi:hypothetical protein
LSGSRPSVRSATAREPALFEDTPDVVDGEMRLWDRPGLDLAFDEAF